MAMMRVARLYEPGAPLRIDTIPVPEPRANDVLVKVAVCGVVPNLKNVIGNYSKRHPSLPPRRLPAIYGLDAAGVVSQVGSAVQGISPGERVYVNPVLTCGGCLACRRGDRINCPDFTFQGYFGFGPGSEKLYEDNPYGGFGEYLTTPAANLVKLPDSVRDEEAARFGYLGTAYSALRKACFGPGKTVLIDGVTGTLGIGAALLALAMGAVKVFGTGRNRELLARVKALAPGRVEPLVLGERPIHEAVRLATAGTGVDALIVTLGPGAPASSTIDSLQALCRGGIAVGCGALAETVPLDPLFFMRRQLQYAGSLWFTTEEGERMAAMAAAGTLDLSVFEHQRFPLERINEAIEAVDRRAGGFTNIVVAP